MPIKLQVVKQDADAGDPADYLFEQDRITIGRGSSNDLTLPDQKVSTEHAEIRSREGEYLLIDRGSKNKTYVDGQRVGETEPYPLESGDVFRVGDFNIEFAPLFMPSSEQTAFADDEDANPFAQHTRQLVSALEGLAETYKFAPSDHREKDFAAAVQEHLDADLGEEEAVQHVLRVLGDSESDTGSPESRQATPAEASTGDEAIDTVLDTLLTAVARMISIPNHFWREFTGNTLTHPPEKDFLYTSDVDALRGHLLDSSISEEERTERLQHVSDAVESLVAHNMAMLAGYKKSVMAGSKALLQRVNPIDAVREAEESAGGMMGGLFGGDEKSEIEALDERWKDLFHGEWGQIESELFRPTYIDAYVDRMAQTWDVDRAELIQKDGNGTE